MEDRKTDADTHLADARSQNTGNGISGEMQKIKAVASAAADFSGGKPTEERT